jgi:hypothetical protein
VRPVAVLDANLLIPRALRDLLLSLADGKVFRPVWQQTILDEFQRNYPKVAARHRGADTDDAVKEVARVLATMTRAFPDASVATDQWISLVEQMTCDEKDRHVLAVALAADATHSRRTPRTFRSRRSLKGSRSPRWTRSCASFSRSIPKRSSTQSK